MGRENNLQNLYKLVLRQTVEEGNEQKGNSGPWRVFYEIIKGRNYQKLGLSGVSRRDR